MSRAYIFIFLTMFLLWPGANSSANPNYAETPEEQAMCQQRVMSRKQPKDPDWMHMHHYCYGLRFYDRAVKHRDDPNDFRFNIDNAIGNYDYVLKHTSQSFKMRPEVIVMRGRALELGGKGAEAAEMYTIALKLNPNFAMAYAALGNFYKQAGDKNQALKIYAEGLRRSPKNKYLRSRYQATGGSLDSLEVDRDNDAEPTKEKEPAPTTADEEAM